MVEVSEGATESATQKPKQVGGMTSLLTEGAAALQLMAAANGAPGLDGADHPSASLPDDGVPGDALWAAVKELTLTESEDELPRLSAVQQQTAVAATCAAYAATLEAGAQRQMLDQLTANVTSWIADIFNQPNMALMVSSESCSSLAAMVRMRLHHRYASYAAAGYECLYARPPVVYVSAACRSADVAALITALGLPGSVVRQVALSAVFGAAHALDVAQLQRMLEEDEAAQKVPLLVVAHAGTPELGHVDNLRRIGELCRERDVWCHVSGPSLAALALVGPPHADRPAATQLGDSLSLDLAHWLGVPWLQPVTLYRTEPPPAGVALPPPPPSLLQTLPLWATLMSLGRRGVVERIRSAFELAIAVESRVVAIPKLQILSARPGKEVAPVTDINKLVVQAVNFTVVLEGTSPVVVFRYHNAGLSNGTYLDNLNSWLGQIMQRDLPEVPIQLLNVEGYGFCLKFSPLTMWCRSLDTQALDEWAECLAQQIEILNATVHHRTRFDELTSEGSLRAVPLANWAGLGAVRFIPAHLQPLMEAGVTDSGKEDINKLNTELLTKLKSTDSAFSIGDGEDGMVCIRFGMVTMDTDVDELCNLLLDLGGQIEESSRFLETMSEMLMKGIAEASKDLRRENEDRLWQEGVLRHVPLVGTFVNWWSPPPRDAVKGRKLDLAEGVLETTEDTYKSHVQVRRTPSTTSGSQQQHSRTSSAASAGMAPAAGGGSALSEEPAPTTAPAPAPTPTAAAAAGTDGAPPPPPANVPV